MVLHYRHTGVPTQLFQLRNCTVLIAWQSRTAEAAGYFQPSKLCSVCYLGEPYYTAYIRFVACNEAMGLLMKVILHLKVVHMHVYIVVHSFAPSVLLFTFYCQGLISVHGSERNC